MDIKSYVNKYRSDNSYTKKADKTITNTGFLMPIGLLIYGLLIQFNIIISPNKIVGPVGFSIIMIIWFIIGFLQKTRPGKTALGSTLRLAEFHIMTGVYFLLVAGIFNPFAAAWPILMIASYIYFENTGLKLSILFILSLVLIDILLIHSGDIRILITDLMIFLTAITTGLVVITVNKTHEIRKQKLFESVVKESLQRERIATIVNNLTDAIIGTDNDGDIKVYNAATLSLLDTNKDLININIDKLLKLEDREGEPVSIISILRQCHNTIQRDDLYYVFSDNERIRLSTTFAPIRKSYSKIKHKEMNDGYILIMRDITKEKSLEEERDEFVSVVSHELRTPITITEGTLSNIQAMASKANVSKKILKDSLNIAHDQVMFLANMVNDLSALSRVENSTDNDLENIDVQELVHNLLTKYNDEAKKKKLKLDIAVDPNIGIIRTNRLYIEELLQNLVTNSIKYTKTGSITIIAEKENEEIIISVKDTGIGISKTDQAKIFQKFYRSEDYRTRESGGTGLGLYVAAKLARKIGTNIKLVSSLNHGSTFSITLPVYKKNDKE